MVGYAAGRNGKAESADMTPAESLKVMYNRHSANSVNY